MNRSGVITVVSMAAALAMARLGNASQIYSSSASGVSGAAAIVAGRIISIEPRKYSRELPDGRDFRTQGMVHQKQWFDEATLDVTELIKGTPQHMFLDISADGDSVRTLHLLIDAGIERSDKLWAMSSEAARTSVGAEGLWFLRSAEIEGTYLWSVGRYESEPEIRECLKTLSSNYAGWEPGFATDDRTTALASNGNSFGRVDTVVYPDGSVAILGRYQKDLELGGKRWFSSPEYDYFLARLTPSGEVTWCRQIGCGPRAWLSMSRGIGESQLIFVTGSSTSCSVFGTPVEYKDGRVVVAVSDDAHVLWTCAMKGRFDDVSMFPEKNQYRIWGTLAESLTCGDLKIHAERGDDWFMGTLDARGRPTTLKAIVLPGIQRANRARLRHDGGVLLAGTAVPPKAASKEDYDAVVCVLSPDGRIQWADTIGGRWGDQAWGIALAPDDRVFASIVITEDAVSPFVAGSAPETKLVAGKRKLYLFAWSAKGKRLWNVPGGGEIVAVGDDGNIYCAGSYGLPGLTEVPDFVPPSRGDRDVYMMCFDQTGHLQWVRRDGGLAQDFVSDLTLLPGNRAILTGFADTKTFIAGHVVDVHGWEGGFVVNLPLPANRPPR